MSTNPTSFRFPFESQISDMPPHHQEVIRTTWNAITDLQGAIPLLKSSIDTKVTSNSTSSSGSTGSSSSSASGSTVTAASVKAQIATAVTALKFSIKASMPGGVNNQENQTSYTTQNSDYGKIIVLSDASPIAVSLSVLSSLPNITLPFYCVIFNEGIGIATLTPISGNINGLASLPIPSEGFGQLYYDGNNFYCAVADSAGSGVTQIIAGTGIDISPVGGTGNVTINISPTTVTPGSYTNTNLTVNAEGQITAASNGSGGTSYLKGTVSVVASGLSGTFRGTGTVAGATTSMAAIASAPALISLCTTNEVSWVADVVSANTVEVQLTLPNIGVSWSTINFLVVVFP